jgi:F0F1-type ATP synthase membrane subunit c/vacuolar-type H+-ATPase subunit K
MNSIKTFLAILLLMLSLNSCNSSMVGTAKEQESFPTWVMQDIPELGLMFLEAGDYTISSTSNEDRTNLAYLRTHAVAMSLIASQPELSNDILDTLTPLSITTDHTKAAYLFHLSAIYEASSLQPELLDTIFIPQTPLIFSSSVKVTTLFEQVARFASYKGLFAAMARQPEMATNLANLAINYARAGADMNNQTSPFVILSRSYAIGSLLDSISRQPEMAGTLVDFAITFLGPKATITNTKVKFASDQFIQRSLLAAIVTQPELEAVLNDALDTLIDYN